LIEENKPYDVEFKIRRETDGAVIDIHSIADFDSETKVVFGVIQDVTEIKQISKQLENQNKELRKTNAELDKFVYSTSHDLRAPLKSVLGLINLIELEEDPDFIKDQMHMMKSSVVKLDDFIEDIMHYYRNTRLVVNPEEIDFEEIISKIKSNFLHTEGFETVKFFVHIDMPEKLCSDKQRIALVLNNLISNAIKYRDQNKQEQHVKIEIHNNIVSTSITVEDNGIGIEENHSEKIFEMFYRATRHSTGSGLGLYIVKETLDKIGGTIYVESEHGIGTKFTVKIPNLHEQ
jgi:signal transduction histidine kinase